MSGSGFGFQPSWRPALLPPTCSSPGAIVLVARLNHCSCIQSDVYGQSSSAEKSGLVLIPLLRE